MTLRRTICAVAALALATVTPEADAFVLRSTPATRVRRADLRMQSQKPMDVYTKQESFAPLGVDVDGFPDGLKKMAPVAGLIMPLVIGASEAAAKGGEYGVLEGRTFAFIHPIVMGILFLGTGYTGYLGWQWRTLRTIGGEISAIKDTLPVLSDGSKISFPAAKQASAIQGTISELDKEAEASKISKLQKDLVALKSVAVVEAENKIAELTEARKALAAGDFRDKHFSTASALLGVGVFVSILGCFDTYFRAGKLFPGPHLFAGAGITVLWAAAAALVPAMQKGQDWARTLHIVFNVANLLLFTWQVGTGLEIALKVWELTKWP